MFLPVASRDNTEHSGSHARSNVNQKHTTMTLREFEKFMESKHNAYWTSFYVAPRDKTERTRVNDKELDEKIQQIDSVGISVGNESYMINLTVWAGDVIQEPINVTSKMLGHNRKECFDIIEDIMQSVETCYYSVNSNK